MTGTYSYCTDFSLLSTRQLRDLKWARNNISIPMKIYSSLQLVWIVLENVLQEKLDKDFISKILFCIRIIHFILQILKCKNKYSNSIVM